MHALLRALFPFVLCGVSFAIGCSSENKKPGKAETSQTEEDEESPKPKKADTQTNVPSVGPVLSKCTPPLAECHGDCIDFATDKNNCGACDHRCADDEICDKKMCKGGKKPPSCAPGNTACGDACAYLAYDNNNCGQCGKKCGEHETCLNSTCKYFSQVCADQEPKNTLTDCSGQCVNLYTDPDHCGSCGRQCADGQECKLVPGEGILCVSVLSETCNGKQVDLKTDNDHCGRCNNACNAQWAEVCIDGTCQAGGI